jgi:hypothetical protein
MTGFGRAKIKEQIEKSGEEGRTRLRSGGVYAFPKRNGNQAVQDASLGSTAFSLRSRTIRHSDVRKLQAGTTNRLEPAEKSWQVNTTLDKWADESLT